MFPVDSAFRFAAYPAYALIGAILGIVSGILASLVMKLRIQRSAVTWDGVLGAATAVVVAELLWWVATWSSPKAISRYYIITTFAFAIAAPVLHQFWRSKRIARSS